MVCKAKSSTDELIIHELNSKQDEFVHKQKNIKEILEIVGEFGKFQWILEALLTFLMVPFTYQIYVGYFTTIEPNWRCVQNSTLCTLNGTFTSDNNFRCSISRDHWEFVDSKENSIIIEYQIYCENAWLIHMISSIFFFGKLVGFIVFGWFSDKFGRKTILFPCFMTMLCFVLLSTLMPNIGWFLFCRFVVGFVGAGYGNIILIVVSEFVSTRYRPVANNLMWVVWSGTLCFLALQSYLIPHWKVLFVVCSAPYIVGIAGVKFVPESIRWLRSNGRTKEAMDIFNRIANWNKRVLDEKVSTCTLPSTRKDSKKLSYLYLFRTKKIAISTSVQCFLSMANAIVYYGISLAADDLGGSLYLNFVYVSLVELPAALIAIDLSNRFGRRRTTCLSILLAGIFCIAVAWVPTTLSYGSMIRIILGVLGKLFISLSYDVVTTWSLELFPTDIRSSGYGCVQLAASIGSTSSPWISKGLTIYHKNLPFYVMGSFALVAGLVGFILPETRGLETKDSVNEEMS